MKLAVTVVDPEGATYGYDGPFVPISHRFLIGNGELSGFESTYKLFDSHQAFAAFVQHVAKQQPGATGITQGIRELSWSVGAP